MEIAWSRGGSRRYLRQIDGEASMVSTSGDGGGDIVPVRVEAGGTFAGMEDVGDATLERQASLGGSGGVGSVRRSKSLNQFPPLAQLHDDASTTSSRFVTKVWCGTFSPEVSLDYLTDEFFRLGRSLRMMMTVRRRSPGAAKSRFPAAPTEKGGDGGQRSSTVRYTRVTESSRGLRVAAANRAARRGTRCSPMGKAI